MGSFLKKDLLVFWRDRKEVLLALFLPIVIIVVLNLAFSGLFDNDAESVNMNVGIVDENEHSTELEQFKLRLQEMDILEVEKEALINQASAIKPSELIVEFFNDPKLKEWIPYEKVSEAEAIKLVEEGDLDAIIKIPEGFTYDVLSSLLLEEDSSTPISILAAEQSMELNTLQNVVNDFIDTLNLQFALGSTVGADLEEPVLPQGGREVVEGVETFNISQYFTIAMSTLFALFIAQTVAMKTVTEKRERVFNRILLTNSNPLEYLMGKTLATFFLSMIQMLVTFAVTQLFLDVFPGKSLAFWVGVIVIIAAFALTVSGLSALFTSITLILNDSNAASGIFTMIVMSFGVLGGSFFPLQGLPVVFQKIGEWIPNGLTQTVLIKWIQLTSVQDLIVPIIILIVFFMACLVIAVTIFPRRGRV
ncbi:ABC transporter permease [Oceanobacillus halophilus]|uniref:ABC transporter permease n=1 Tax=Oceanobacillus halophilus TaxID=930130 RepID=A0A495A4K5_9BACI|nr:ABC transporter permease [Oceanobacillus halophilus]RKQ34572.1 ABC transporter permease [Oceanobacillus halophilus]